MMKRWWNTWNRWNSDLMNRTSSASQQVLKKGTFFSSFRRCLISFRKWAAMLVWSSMAVCRWEARNTSSSCGGMRNPNTAIWWMGTKECEKKSWMTMNYHEYWRESWSTLNYLNQLQRPTVPLALSNDQRNLIRNGQWVEWLLFLCIMLCIYQQIVNRCTYLNTRLYNQESHIVILVLVWHIMTCETGRIKNACSI